MSGIIVLKLGGQIASGELHHLSQTTRQLQDLGRQVVWVHGGGSSITEALKNRGIVLPFKDGQRMTSPEAMNVVEHVLCKVMNPSLVDALQFHGVHAVGMSTAKDGILVASPLRNGWRTGRIESVRTQAICDHLQDGKVPVIAPIGMDSQGLHYNMNADAAAAAIAGALEADRMVFLTDVRGVYEDMSQGEVIPRTNTAALASMLANGCFQGGMVPKVQAILAAIQAGVQAVYVVHGQDLTAIQWAAGLTTDANGMTQASEFNESSDGVSGTCVTPIGEEIA